MNEAEWKTRVREEKAELCNKLAKLRVFQTTADYAALSCDERRMLSAQENIMQQYADVLGDRIAKF